MKYLNINKTSKESKAIDHLDKKKENQQEKKKFKIIWDKMRSLEDNQSSKRWNSLKKRHSNVNRQNVKNSDMKRSNKKLYSEKCKGKNTKLKLVRINKDNFNCSFSSKKNKKSKQNNNR